MNSNPTLTLTMLSLKSRRLTKLPLGHVILPELAESALARKSLSSSLRGERWVSAHQQRNLFSCRMILSWVDCYRLAYAKARKNMCMRVA